MEEKNIVTLFKDTICSKFIPKKNWDANISFETPPDGDSFCFTLDRENLKNNTNPFNFFSATPPKDITKINDAIYVISYKNKNYIVLIELKGKYNDDYKKQMINGKLFCEWVINLFQKHKHFKDSVTFRGLLINKPREKQQRKSRNNGRKPLTIEKEFYVYKIRNPKKVLLDNFIK